MGTEQFTDTRTGPRPSGRSPESDDPLRATLRGMWSAVSGSWAEHADYVDRRQAGVAERMLHLTAPGPGMRVLELACGPGGLGLAAAPRVLPGGDVVLSDVVAEMTAIAACRAAELGLAHVATTELDLEHITEPDRSYDVVLCREGLMFTPDPSRRAGDRTGAPARWSGGPHRVGTARPQSLARPRLRRRRRDARPTRATAGVPGPFALSDADHLASLFTDAGLVDVEVEEVAVPVRALVGLVLAEQVELGDLGLRERVVDQVLGDHHPGTELRVLVVHAQLEEMQQPALLQAVAERDGAPVEAQERQAENPRLGGPPGPGGVERDPRWAGEDRRAGGELPLAGLQAQPLPQPPGQVPVPAVRHLEHDLAGLGEPLLQALEPVPAVLGQPLREVGGVAPGLDVGRGAPRRLEHRNPVAAGGGADRRRHRVLGEHRVEVDVTGAAGQQTLGELPGGLLVGRHRGDHRRLGVYRCVQRQGAGRHRQHPDQRAASVDGERAEGGGASERSPPRRQPTGARKDRGSDGEGERVPGLDQVGVEGLQAVAAHDVAPGVAGTVPWIRRVRRW